MNRLALLAGLLALAAFAEIPERIAQTFVDLLAAGEFNRADQYFDPQVAALIPDDKLQQIWEGVQADAGRYSRQLGIRTQTTGALTIVLVDTQFEKKVLSIQVVLNAEGKIAGLHFLPYHPPIEAKLPAGVTEQPLTVGDLPGTLALPQGKGPFSAVVLVHGSGPNDRDETLGPNKPFRDLAWGLAARGIAVLRYDKRTKVHPEPVANFTVKQESIDDAVAAAALLRKRPEVDSKRVFVLGHSLGGMLAPRIAKADTALAGVIIMAGPTAPIEDTIVRQIGLLAPDKLEMTKAQAAAVKNIKAGDQAFGVPASYWLDLRDYHPAEFAKTVSKPMLILQGERDYQVTMQDFAVWQKTLAGRANVAFKFYPSLNHLFLAGEGQSRPAEYDVPGRIPDQVIEDIANWIRSVKPQ